MMPWVWLDFVVLELTVLFIVNVAVACLVVRFVDGLLILFFTRLIYWFDCFF